MKESILAFSDFRNNLENCDQLSNGDIQFIGVISYKFNQSVIRETLNVRLGFTTMEVGNITIEEGKKLTSELVHLDFKANFQNYRFSDGILTVTGSSNKLGEYTVEIFELV